MYWLHGGNDTGWPVPVIDPTQNDTLCRVRTFGGRPLRVSM
jgi:hypothetical protein